MPVLGGPWCGAGGSGAADYIRCAAVAPRTELSLCRVGGCAWSVCFLVPLCLVVWVHRSRASGGWLSETDFNRNKRNFRFRPIAKLLESGINEGGKAIVGDVSHGGRG